MRVRATSSLLLAALVALPVAALWTPQAARAAVAPRAGVVEVRTVPAVPDVRISLDGTNATTDAAGTARVSVSNLDGVAERLRVADGQVGADQQVAFDRVAVDPNHLNGVRRLVVGLTVRRKVQISFADPKKRPVQASRVSLLELQSSVAGTTQLRGAALTQPIWLDTNRILASADNLMSKDIQYQVKRVLADGGEVVNQGQQRFTPALSNTWSVRLLFYRLVLTSRDALFGGPIGTGVDVTKPDGTVVHTNFDSNDNAVIDSAARGEYSVRVRASGLSLKRPVKVSRDQKVSLQVISLADIVTVFGALLAVAVALLLFGGAHLRRRIRHEASRLFRRRAAVSAGSDDRPHPDALKIGGFALLLAVGLFGAGVWAPAHASAASAAPSATASPAPSADQPAPIFAYYYIWYTQSSWQRAKSDYPLLGRYSSDDASIMQRHLKEAKAAGITGFLVSWKHSQALDRRLAQLVNLARNQHFSLGLVYESLTHDRIPLPTATVARDLGMFADLYAKEPAFRSFGKPVVIWSGSDRYSAADVAAVTGPLRSRLQVLASAKSVKAYDKIADQVDGNAYYWSSVRPDSRIYPAKLSQLSTAVHSHHGLWFAPVAPGFDARLVGGTTVVDRKGGETLRREMAVARASSPDAIGLISWNEFSENTHVEPSKKYGDSALRTLQDVLGTGVSVGDSPDSSSEGSAAGTLLRFLPLGLAGIAGAALTAVIVRRRRPRRLAPTGR